MLCSRFRPQWVQLRRNAVAAVRARHPWIYRPLEEPKAWSTFKAGQWLTLHDESRACIGFGLYEPVGLTAIRVLRLGQTPPSLDFWKECLHKALLKRAQLQRYTNAFRVLHGENDGVGGVVLDKYADTLVLQTYSPAVDTLGRYMALLAREALKVRHVVWKTPTRRLGKESDLNAKTRVLYGNPPDVVSWNEGKHVFNGPLLEGQKTGTFLDLRGLRKWFAREPLAGRTILNLFCYTGTLSAIADRQGARVWNVDECQPALAFAEQHHTQFPARHRFLREDVFRWIASLEGHQFDYILCDPPQMASQASQIHQVLRTYFRLYSRLARHVRLRGKLVTVCCTGRIRRKRYEECLGQALSGFRLVENLHPESDHPVRFKDGDYLKILVWERVR